jgi:hypothetical protein
MTHRIYPLSNKQNIGGLSFSERVKSETHKKKIKQNVSRKVKQVLSKIDKSVDYMETRYVEKDDLSKQSFILSHDFICSIVSWSIQT